MENIINKRKERRRREAEKRKREREKKKEEWRDLSVIEKKMGRDKKEDAEGGEEKRKKTWRLRRHGRRCVGAGEKRRRRQRCDSDEASHGEAARDGEIALECNRGDEGEIGGSGESWQQR